MGNLARMDNDFMVTNSHQCIVRLLLGWDFTLLSVIACPLAMTGVCFPMAWIFLSIPPHGAPLHHKQTVIAVSLAAGNAGRAAMWLPFFLLSALCVRTSTGTLGLRIRC